MSPVRPSPADLVSPMGSAGYLLMLSVFKASIFFLSRCPNLGHAAGLLPRFPPLYEKGNA